jgi:hypothetical protein
MEPKSFMYMFLFLDLTQYTKRRLRCAKIFAVREFLPSGLTGAVTISVGDVRSDRSIRHI